MLWAVRQRRGSKAATSNLTKDTTRTVRQDVWSTLPRRLQ